MFPATQEVLHMEDFETRLRSTLADYGITDVTVIDQGEDCVTGERLVCVLTGDTDDIDVSDMVRTDILEQFPVWLHVHGHGAGKTFRYEGWNGCGGAMWYGRVGSRVSFARSRYQMARATVANMSQLDPIRADGMLDLAVAAFEAERDRAILEGEDGQGYYA
jgi:hypothetical protein